MDLHARIADLVEENHRLKIQIKALKEENGMLGAECLEAEKERLMKEQEVDAMLVKWADETPSTPPTELVELHGTDGKFEISRQRRWMND